MKTLIKFILFLFILGLAALGGYLFLDKGETRDTFTFIPDDFVYVIESDRPVQDWQDLSKSKVWQFLKGNDYFADISGSADYLDSLLSSNQTLLKLVKLGDLAISAHMISRENYDFIFLVDLRSGGKLGKLQAFLTPLFNKLEYEVSRESYFNIDILKLYDPLYDETLSLAIVDNILVGSYQEDLVKKAIQQTERPTITENEDFAVVQERTSRDELYTIYFNYKTINKLVLAYTNDLPTVMEGVEEILSFSSLDLSLSDDRAVFSGYLKQVDTVPSFLSVFKDAGQGKVQAANLLPENTAMFSSIGFDDFLDFYTRLNKYYEQNSPDEHKKLQKNIGLTEKLLKISFEQDFFIWMTEEIATAVVPIDESGKKYATYAILHFDNYELTKEKLDFVTEQIRKRTPAKFQTVDYRGFEIKYLDMNKFFKLFFKKMFDEIEKPHYTYIDDYVVFSNDTTSLQYLIEAYVQKKTLNNKEAYKDFRSSFDSKSNMFTYIQTDHFYQYLRQDLDREAKINLDKNKDYLLSFPQIGMQLSPSSNMYEVFLLGDFVEKLEEETD